MSSQIKIYTLDIILVYIHSLHLLQLIVIKMKDLLLSIIVIYLFGLSACLSLQRYKRATVHKDTVVENQDDLELDNVTLGEIKPMYLIILLIILLVNAIR